MFWCLEWDGTAFRLSTPCRAASLQLGGLDCCHVSSTVSCRVVSCRLRLRCSSNPGKCYWQHQPNMPCRNHAVMQAELRDKTVDGRRSTVDYCDGRDKTDNDSSSPSSSSSCTVSRPWRDDGMGGPREIRL